MPLKRLKRGMDYVFGETEHEFVRTDDARIGGYPPSFTTSTEMAGNIQHVTGAAVAVPGKNTTETILDVSEPVIILAGTLNGRSPGNVVYEFADGEQATVGGPGYSTGRDDAGNLFDSRALPPGRDIVRVTFDNLNPDEREYGYVVDFIEG